LLRGGRSRFLLSLDGRRSHSVAAASASRRQRTANKPELACQIMIRQRAQPIPDLLKTGLAQKVLDQLAGARPQMSRGRPDAKERNIAFLQIDLLRRNQTRHLRSDFDPGPEPVQQPVTVERAAQHVGVKTLLQNLRVDLCGASYQAHLVAGETAD